MPEDGGRLAATVSLATWGPLASEVRVGGDVAVSAMARRPSGEVGAAEPLQDYLHKGCCVWSPPMNDDHQAVTDSRVLAAMSHPARRRLLDALYLEGPSNVSMLAARTGMAIGSVSHHLKVLSQASLVEESPDLARDHRERWWTAASSGRRWSTTSFRDDPASAVVAAAASSLNLEHHISKVRAWQSRSDEAQDDWLEAAFATDTWLRLSADELRELSKQLNELLAAWHSRLVPDDGAVREDVFVFAHGVPAGP